MIKNKTINQLSLKEKLLQMFILGFKGTSLNNNNLPIQNAVKEGLGGVIFFADNFEKREQFIDLVNNLQSIAKAPLLTSIDQEGGLVERTIKLDKKIQYLTPMALSQSNDPELIKLHTKIMSEDLKNLGINMNFAPVLDVNTNVNNPIIGIRAYGATTANVINNAIPTINEFKKNNIIPVGKHFPGHGEAWVDSHLDMPEINLTFDELENTHIEPFKQAINKGLDAIMVAHVHYTCFNKGKKPASLSKAVITNYLKQKLNYKGLIISDDMVMGGITKHYNRYEACIKAINAGIDLFIFKDSNPEIIETIEKLENAIEKGLISESRIDESVSKILYYKNQYKISNKPTFESSIDIEKAQEIINQIALNTIKISKKGNSIPLIKNKKYCILSPDKKDIYNYSYDKSKLSDFIEPRNIQEIHYSITPSENEIADIQGKLSNFDTVIFLSYNAVFNFNQIELYNRINSMPVITIMCGVPYDEEYFSSSDSIITSSCYKTPSLEALAKYLYK